MIIRRHYNVMVFRVLGAIVCTIRTTCSRTQRLGDGNSCHFSIECDPCACNDVITGGLVVNKHLTLITRCRKIDFEQNKSCSTSGQGFIGNASACVCVCYIVSIVWIGNTVRRQSGMSTDPIYTIKNVNDF